jgi:hypothetical protein
LILVLAACRSHGTPERRATGDARPGDVVEVGDAPNWTRTFSGGNNLATGIAATTEGVVVVGNYDGALATDGADAAATGDSDLFVARLGEDGAIRWLRGLGSTKADFAWSVAAVDGTTVVAGESDGTIEFDGERTRTDAQEQLDYNPPLALAFDVKGARAWWRAFASEDGGTLRAVSAAGGRIAVGGQTIGRDEARDLGAGVIPCDMGAAFVAQLDATGRVGWARCTKTKFGTGVQGVKHIASGRDGSVAACGNVRDGQMSFGGDVVEHDSERGPAGGELFVASFSPDGAPRWLIAPAGQTRDSTCSGIAILDDGTVVVATNADGALAGVALPEGAIIALDASGKPRWTASLPGLVNATSAPVTALTVSGSRIWVAGLTRDEGLLVGLDAASGAAVGAPRRLGDIDPRAVAATGDAVYVAGRRPIRGETHDAVVMAVPARP